VNKLVILFQPFPNSSHQKILGLKGSQGKLPKRPYQQVLENGSSYNKLVAFVSLGPD
jgi:hypothetical protein